MATVGGGAAPPQRRSSWSWRGIRSRRNSLSGSPVEVPAPPTPVSAAPPPVPRPGRHSLPAVGTRTAQHFGDEVHAISTAPTSVRASYVGGRRESDAGAAGGAKAGGAGAAGAKNSRPATASRPPPAFFNRPYNLPNSPNGPNTRPYNPPPPHRRQNSASATLQRSYVHYDESLLKPPPSRFRNPEYVDPVISMATAVPIYPVVMLPMKGTVPVAMFHPKDQDFIMRTQRSSEKFRQTTASQPTHGTFMYSPLINIIPTAYPNPQQNAQSPMMPTPTLHARPRSISASSVSSTGSRFSSMTSLSNASPNSSQTSIESMPPCSPGCRRTPGGGTYYQLQGQPWQRPALIKNRRKAEPGELFAALPGSVLELILQELRHLHQKPGSDSCETCWMRDCCSISLSARKFLKYAREALYQHIILVGPESPQMKKRTKLEYGSRLVLLRRTLRANMHIAVIVRSLKPPSLPPGDVELEYNDLVASVVMACPNLERLLGYYPTYDHSFQRVFQAFSTRKRLKEMSWNVGNAAPPRPGTARPGSARPGPSSIFSRQQQSPPLGTQHFGPGELVRHQSQGFLDFHQDWKQLTTLTIHCQPGASLPPDTLITKALRRLPALQNLVVSHLPPSSFSDNSLLRLPPLKKLTLSHLPGVTTTGLATFATRTSSTSLTSLTLIHINLETLPALARLFSNLTSLTTFNLLQSYAPIMPSDEVVCLFPYLASSSLARFHWDIPYVQRSTTADNILARSVRAGGFPALRALRAPNDPEGIFQALCRPLDRADLPTDRYRPSQTLHRQTSSQTQAHRPSSSWSTGTANHGRSASLADPLFPPDALMMPRENSDLLQARLAAQGRLERARRFPRFFIDVIDERGMVVEKYGVGAFLGTIGSKVNYVLTADEGGTDEGGGLVGVGDVISGDCGEDLKTREAETEKTRWGSKRRESFEAKVREGCIGIWNAGAEQGKGEGKKGREGKEARDRWYHVERGRWRGLVPS